jgi:hypothetical protein
MEPGRAGIERRSSEEKKMPRRRSVSYRASVVSVVAAFAAGPACGDDEPDDDGSSLCSVFAPPIGSACEGSGSCKSPACGPYGWVGEIECKDGKIEGYVGTCNPPGPLDSGLRDAGDLDARQPDASDASGEGD